MLKANRLMSSLVLMSTLAVPVAMSARTLPQEEHHDRDRNRDRDHDRRFYDEHRREYHTWGPEEDRAYRHWLEERHRKYVAWEKLRARDRQAYWDWRHEHRDWGR